MLDYPDISLVPRVVSTIESRDHVEIQVPFNEIICTSPIIASPMKDVCDGKAARELRRLGGLGIIHRFISIEEQAVEFKKGGACGCAIGVNGDCFERFSELYKQGCKIFCIDTANGANTRVKRTLETLADYSCDVIVGNVASKECYDWLQRLPNVRAIRVGIAGGAACTTRNATGIYHGTASCIQECASVKSGPLLIADGGIQEPADLCKAIACGADLIMLGSSIAATTDSPAELIKRDGKLYKVYHGSASFEIQKEYRDKPKYVEGKTRLLPYDAESLETLVARFCDGLRSCMSYFNATDLYQFRQNVSISHTKSAK